MTRKCRHSQRPGSTRAGQEGWHIVKARPPARPLLVALLAAALLAALSPSASPAADFPTRPRIGLALSGGGARGAAHVGVLQVLEEHRIPVDLVTGTSMGALVGGLFASGLSPAELDSVISNMDWNSAFADQIPRRDRSFRRKREDDLYLVRNKPGLRGGRLVFPPGILDGYQIDLLLKRLTLPVVTIRDFDRLPTPYRAVAADIVNGEAVVMDHGDLALAMRCSMSIPAAFAPREVDGRLLVDGGIADNLPIRLARDMGAEVIIAVDISSPPQGRAGLTSVIAIATQLATLASDREKDRQVATLTDRDIFIRPDLGRITVASFDYAAEAIPRGRKAAEAALPRLEKLAVSPEEYAAWLAARAASVPPGGPPVPAALSVVNRSRLADDVLAARLRVPVGERLDVDRLEDGLDRIFGLELFESVYYDFSPGPQGEALSVTAREKAWGPNYLQAGMAVFEDFEGPNFNLAFAYSRTAMNGRNGEWRTGLQVGQEPGAWTEFHQPLDRGLKTFAALELAAIERTLSVFDARGHKLSELGIRHWGGEVAAGREFGTWAELRAGLVREGGSIRPQVGEVDLPVREFDTGEAFAQAFVDRLDDVAFPHHGGTLRLRANFGLEALGSDTEYEQLLAEGSFAGSIGRYTGLVGALFATTRDDDAPLQNAFRLGGLARLSGLEQDELVGQHAMLLTGMLYRRIANFQILPLYLGVSAEYGNVFQRRTDVRFRDGRAAGSVIFGMDTLLGPFCVAYGIAEGDRGNFYLTLGQPLGGRRPGFRER